ncbi:DUF4185 domain-containing protein, partial [Nocardia vinacea]|uniref:DUF4185 domain-containing protein n=1 Tax=Nocardia vinacea TaxID=96468 RepID=UPI003418E296
MKEDGLFYDSDGNLYNSVGDEYFLIGADPTDIRSVNARRVGAVLRRLGNAHSVLYSTYDNPTDGPIAFGVWSIRNGRLESLNFLAGTFPADDTQHFEFAVQLRDWLIHHRVDLSEVEIFGTPSGRIWRSFSPAPSVDELIDQAGSGAEVIFHGAGVDYQVDITETAQIPGGLSITFAFDPTGATATLKLTRSNGVTTVRYSHKDLRGNPEQAAAAMDEWHESMIAPWLAAQSNVIVEDDESDSDVRTPPDTTGIEYRPSDNPDEVQRQLVELVDRLMSDQSAEAVDVARTLAARIVNAIFDDPVDSARLSARLVDRPGGPELQVAMADNRGRRVAGYVPLVEQPMASDIRIERSLDVVRVDGELSTQVESSLWFWRDAAQARMVWGVLDRLTQTADAAGWCVVRITQTEDSTATLSIAQGQRSDRREIGITLAGARSADATDRAVQIALAIDPEQAVAADIARAEAVVRELTKGWSQYEGVLAADIVKRMLLDARPLDAPDLIGWFQIEVSGDPGSRLLEFRVLEGQTLLSTDAIREEPRLDTSAASRPVAAAELRPEQSGATAMDTDTEIRQAAETPGPSAATPEMAPKHPLPPTAPQDASAPTEHVEPSTANALVVAAVPNEELTALFASYGVADGGWTGADSTYSLRLPDGRHLWMFSDVFLGTVNPDGSRSRPSKMVNTSFVVQSDGEMSTVHRGTTASPRPLMQAGKGEFYWLGGGYVTGNTVDIMFIRFARNGRGVMNAVWQENLLARFDADDLSLIDTNPMPSAAGVAWSAWLDHDGTHTYIYGTEDLGADKYMHVARVLGNDLRGQWEYFDGTGWSANENDSTRVMSGVANEYSVTRWRGRYLLITQDTATALSPQILAYLSDSPTGPFTEPTLVYQAPEAGASGSYGDPNVFIYNAHEHPDLRSGDTLTVSYNVNSLDFNGIFDDVSKYQPRFVTVTLNPGLGSSTDTIDGTSGPNTSAPEVPVESREPSESATTDIPDYIRKCLVQTVRASWAVGYDQATIPHEDADTWKD